MIGRLEGRIVRVEPGTVLVDAGGVGYLVATTLRAFDRLRDGESAALWIHTLVRDDAIVLFGFPERDELAAFERLIAVAGVGPRTALAVLSAMTVDELAATVEHGDTVPLERAPGVGRKTAQRILLELRGRLDALRAAAGRGDPRSDAVSALVNLGYSERDARLAVEHALADGDGDGAEIGEVLRRALRSLTT